MQALLIAGGVVALILLVYLFFALLFPEKLS
jgi:K+-transporting ATPase KdpF subunit